MAAGTRDLTAGTAGARPANYTLNPFLIKQTINFNEVARIKGSAIEANEVIQAISVPAGTFVQRVLVKIKSAGAATGLVATVGDGDDTDGYDTSVDLTAAAGTITTSGLTLTEGTPNTLVDAFAAGKAYTADDTIDLRVTTYNTVTVLPVVQVVAVCVAL